MTRLSSATMQGVTTAIVAFIFFCVIFPERVRNRPQFYASLGLVALIILLEKQWRHGETLARVVGGASLAGGIFLALRATIPA